MSKALFNKVCIVGVGLIGGSLGMAIKKRKIARLVVGVMRRRRGVARNLSTAFRRKALDAVVLSIKEGVQDADLVILCAPVSVIVKQLKQVASFLKRNTIVIDVGSSKVEINRTALKFLKKNEFIGCHPMAGSEKCGIEFADGRLFEKSICFITRRNQRITRFWKALGATPIPIKQREHDAWVARASHLPHALAFALFQKIPRSDDPAGHPYNPSLQDLARLTQSDPNLWTDVFMSNQKQVLEAIAEFQKSLSSFQKALRTKNRRALARFISHANRQAS